MRLPVKLFLPVLVLFAAAQTYVGKWHSYTSLDGTTSLIAHGGKVYAGTKGGIRVIDPGTLQETDYSNLDGLLDCWITGMAETQDGTLWAVSRSGYLYSLSGSRWNAYGQSYAALQWLMNTRAVMPLGSFLILGSEKGLTVFDIVHGVAQMNLKQFSDKLDLSVLSLLRKKDTLYVGTPAGVYKAGIDTANPVNPGSKYQSLSDPHSWISVSLPATSPARQYDFLAFSGSTLNTYGPGTLLQAPVHVEAFDGKPFLIGAKTFSSSTNLTSALLVNGLLFLGGSTGLSYSANPSASNPTLTALPSPNQFPRDTLLSIGVRQNILWAQSTLQAYGIDPSSENTLSTASLFGSPTPEIVTDHLRNLKVGNHGDAYIGSWGLGLIRVMNGQKKIWSRSAYPCIVQVADGAPDYTVVGGVSDFHNNHFFFSAFAGHEGSTHQLVHIDTSTGKLDCMPFDVPGYLPHVIRFFSDTLIGIGSDRGVALYKFREGFTVPVLTPFGLWTGPGSANETWGLAPDPWGRPWMLAGDNLAYGDSLDDLFKSGNTLFKAIDGFTGTGCYSLENDPAGALWVGCGNGVFRVEPNIAGGATSIQHFGLADGLVGLTVSDLSVDPSNGHVWFATDRGISMLESAAQPPVQDLQTVAVYPNPFRPQHRFVIIDNLPRDATVRIYSAGGAVVRIFHPRDLIGNQAQWDGKNENGRAVANGVYLFSATSGSAVQRGKIIVAR